MRRAMMSALVLGAGYLGCADLGFHAVLGGAVFGCLGAGLAAVWWDLWAGWARG